jgi:hypothetical protein
MEQIKKCTGKRVKIKAAILASALLVGSFLAADLIDFYNKGPIVMKPDPEYANLDYESLFYDPIKKIAVAPDGSIFVSNSKEHNIHKFKEGKLLKTFGRKGLGPGDLYHPGEMAILDNKYLIVNEYALTMRISVFDLEGNFLQAVKNAYPVFDVTALTNNKIAILTQHSIEDQNHSAITYQVIIKDIKTGEEIKVTSFTEKSKKVANAIKCGDYDGKVYTSRIERENLLVGYSSSPEIAIYSPQGKKIKSFRIPIQRKKITREMKEESRQIMRENIERKPKIKQMMKGIKWEYVFPEYVPFYRNLAVDSDDNMLIFDHNGFARIDDLKFQVYNRDGKYLLDSKIDFGEFKLKSNLQLLFVNGFLYSLLDRKDTEDILLQIVKVKIK